MELKVYGAFASRAFRVLWLLEEVGASYQFIPIDLAKLEHRSTSFLKLNPAGKVPVLQHGELVVSESCAILNYIGSLYPETGLVPESSDPKRSKYDQWCFYLMCELEQAVWTKAKHRFALPRAYRIWSMEEVARYEFAQAQNVVSEHIYGNNYLLGDKFSAADILLAHILNWGRIEKLALLPSCEEYLLRMRGRPSFNRVIEKYGVKKAN